MYAWIPSSAAHICCLLWPVLMLCTPACSLPLQIWHISHLLPCKENLWWLLCSKGRSTPLSPARPSCRGMGTARRQDRAYTHRQCHDHRAASQPLVTPPTTPSTTARPARAPHPCSCGSGQTPRPSSCCLGSTSTWNVGRWGTQGVTGTPEPPFLPPQPQDLSSASAWHPSPSCKPFPAAGWFLSCSSELHPY